MKRQDLERIAYLLGRRLRVPDELTAAVGAFEQAIQNWAKDPAGRSLDYWLALPPRSPGADIDYARQRDELYKQLAATIAGSALYKSRVICTDLEIWQSGDAPSASFSAAFEIFLRGHRELELPHLKQTALRAVISAKSCQ